MMAHWPNTRLPAAITPLLLLLLLLTVKHGASETPPAGMVVGSVSEPLTAADGSE